jgi:hypothetical protein
MAVEATISPTKPAWEGTFNARTQRLISWTASWARPSLARVREYALPSRDSEQPSQALTRR